MPIPFNVNMLYFVYLPSQETRSPLLKNFMTMSKPPLRMGIDCYEMPRAISVSFMLF